MSLPYFLGCPAWGDLARQAEPGLASADPLALYCQSFNAVEGNTTFYAWPSETTVQRWAQVMPDAFRFTAKLPRDISHGGDLRDVLGALDRFEQLLKPLGERISPLWLQLPASFGPARLAELHTFIEAVRRPLAVEVRHPAFFDRSDDERALNRLLRDQGVERICLDTRALFSCAAVDAAVVDAQRKKPRLPVRPTAFTSAPQLRFVGHPLLGENERFLAPWLDKFADWIDAGHTPHAYLHMADNRHAPALARAFHAHLARHLPGLPPLPAVSSPAAPQLDLLPS